MINRAKPRGKKLDEDCKRAYTSTNEYGPDDDETEVKICDSRLPVYDPIEICDFADDEDGALIIEGE